VVGLALLAVQGVVYRYAWLEKISMTDNPTTDEPPTVTAFIKQLEEVRKEIGCDGTHIGAHKLRSFVKFQDVDGNLYRLRGFEPSMLFGCGCWDGVYITIEREADDE